MKFRITILWLLLLIAPSCKKNNAPPVSGTVTIDNRLYGTNDYYAIGFSFVSADKVSTKSTNPKPDFIIDTDGTLENLMLQPDNLQNSFYKAGEYADGTAAKKAFAELTSPSVQQWAVWADHLKANQVWIYRSATDHYAKIRIISTKAEAGTPRDYAECTFEWRYQPDGTLTFPAK